MNWIYEQTTGNLRDRSHSIVGAGYSGRDDGRMNPAMESFHNTGPIPRGEWTIGEALTHPRLGPLAIPLTPRGDVFGRSGFFIHGDSAAHPGLASDGCVILAQIYRRKFQAGDLLIVVDGL